jgi:hypothetical protein
LTNLFDKLVRFSVCYLPTPVFKGPTTTKICLNNVTTRNDRNAFGRKMFEKNVRKKCVFLRKKVCVFQRKSVWAINQLKFTSSIRPHFTCPPIIFLEKVGRIRNKSKCFITVETINCAYCSCTPLIAWFITNQNF